MSEGSEMAKHDFEAKDDPSRAARSEDQRDRSQSTASVAASCSLKGKEGERDMSQKAYFEFS